MHFDGEVDSFCLRVQLTKDVLRLFEESHKCLGPRMVGEQVLSEVETRVILVGNPEQDPEPCIRDRCVPCQLASHSGNVTTSWLHREAAVVWHRSGTDVA